MGWDKGIDFEKILHSILYSLRHSKKLNKCYDSILLIQLTNGARISEAIEAFMRYILHGKSECEVRVRKSKNKTRLIIIPRHVREVDLTECNKLLEVDFKKIEWRVAQYCLRKYKCNTHSLRYAFITYLIRNGVDATLIAKITKHSKLDMILHYTQQKVAENILRTISESI